MGRITEKDLKHLIDRLNEVTKSPAKPWENGAANIGNYHLYFAYGSTAVHQMMTKGGGVRQIVGLGTKRETYEKLNTLLSGIEIGQIIDQVNA